jgi:cysteine desulfuration protein SufE
MPSTPLPPALAKIVSRLQQATDPKQRYEYILWLAKKLPTAPDAMKTPENKVSGCVSQVYVVAEQTDNQIWFSGDSDAQITKGLLALLIQGMNGLTLPEILALTPDFIKATGLDVSLTPSRANGFYNIFKKMQDQASHCIASSMATGANGTVTGAETYVETV